jgi:hypothetical protein
VLSSTARIVQDGWSTNPRAIEGRTLPNQGSLERVLYKQKIPPSVEPDGIGGTAAVGAAPVVFAGKPRLAGPRVSILWVILGRSQKDSVYTTP